MPVGKTKIDTLHDRLPKYLNTRNNPGWSAILDTLGRADQNTADLIEEVRKQFFVKTASRPYIDRLAANSSVSRPKQVGMTDPDFRKYIPIVAYQPKQVKLIIDQLVDLFFSKESTTSFIQASVASPYFLKDGWELSYNLDGYWEENIIFKTTDFTDITNATSEEVASVINKTAKHSFAVSYYDAGSNSSYLRIFSRTIGSKGSITITGGRANISLQFTGFKPLTGNSVDTVWNITRNGNSTTFTYVSGTVPYLTGVDAGDVALIEIPNNYGSFTVLSTDLVNFAFTVDNQFAVPMTFDHSSDPTSYVRFFTPTKFVVFTKELRAVTWEVTPGEIIVEMPYAPPVVKRSLKGSAHVNGIVGSVADIPSSSSLLLASASDWPTEGQFILQPRHEILTSLSSKTFNSSFSREITYTYTSKTGNLISGVTPGLPNKAAIHSVSVLSSTRVGNIVTVVTTTTHDFETGDSVILAGTTNILPMLGTVDGPSYITSIPNNTSFICRIFGDDGVATGGTATVERIDTAQIGSLAYLTTARTNTGILGAYIWDLQAPFVISALGAVLNNSINAGAALRNINIIVPNTIPSEECYLIFDFGKENEEGPVRCLSKPNDDILAIDPTYIFEYSHPVGSNITMIRRKGAQIIASNGAQFSPYITDPTVARTVLQDLIGKVKSVGIFIQYLVRYPQQYYQVMGPFDNI